jgi:hypothetical protein
VREEPTATGMHRLYCTVAKYLFSIGRLQRTPLDVNVVSTREQWLKECVFTYTFCLHYTVDSNVWTNRMRKSAHICMSLCMLTTLRPLSTMVITLTMPPLFVSAML